MEAEKNQDVRKFAKALSIFIRTNAAYHRNGVGRISDVNVIDEVLQVKGDRSSSWVIVSDLDSITDQCGNKIS